MPYKNRYSVTRSFGDLKVRVKLIVLHNLFFLVLASSAYFSLIPLFEQQVAGGRPPAVAQADPDYQAAVSRAKTTLFLVLGAIYAAAVILLSVLLGLTQALAALVPHPVDAPRAGCGCG